MKMHVKGLITLVSAVDESGNRLSTQKIVDYGLVVPGLKRQPRGWGLAKEEVPIAYNLQTSSGRQLLAYLFGGRTPASNYVCSKFGVGTGTTAPNVSNTALESPLSFYIPPLETYPIQLKPITGVDYPAPFIARVEFSLAAGDANGADGNGTLITEMGLFSGDGTLVARETNTGISKQSSFSPTMLWRIRY